ncbi:hypothetical protein AB0337_004165 [Klebsiella variicola]
MGNITRKKRDSFIKQIIDETVTSKLQKIAEKFTAMGILGCFLITGRQLNLTCSGIPVRKEQSDEYQASKAAL